MKKGNLHLVTVVLNLVLSAGICSAAAVTPNWVAYDYQTAVEPPTNFVDGTSSAPMADFCKIVDGVLVFNTAADPAAGPTYKLMIPNAAAGFKFTAVIKAKADADLGLDFDFRTGIRERITLSNTAITLVNTGKSDSSFKTTDWHTYFLSYEITGDGKLVTKVYLDGATTTLVEGLSTAADSSGYFRFGDGSGSKPYASSIDWIIWTFDGAFSPDQVNLPAGFSLK